MLSGLALYNMARTTSHVDDSFSSKINEEECKLGIIETNHQETYQEVKVDCAFMSSFIMDEMKGVKNNEEMRTAYKTVTPINPDNEKGSPIEVTEGITCFLI